MCEIQTLIILFELITPKNTIGTANNQPITIPAISPDAISPSMNETLSFYGVSKKNNKFIIISGLN